MRFWLLCLGLGAALLAQDRLQLKNGDRLRGRLLGIADGKVRFRAGGAQLTIPLPHVAALVSPRPWRATLLDGRTLQGPLAADPAGMRVGATPVPLSRLRTLVDLTAPPPKKKIWRGRLGASGLLAQGNTRERAAHADAELEGKWSRTRLLLAGAWDYGERDGKLTARKWHARLKGDWYVLRAGYAYARLLLENDDFQGLRLRTTSGLGTGISLLERPGTELDLELGVSWVHEDRFPLRGGPPTRDQGFASADGRVRWRQDLRPGVTLTEELKAFQSLKDREDLRLDNNLGLDIALAAGLALTLRWLWQYDNQPVPGARRIDTRYVAGVTYKF